MQKVLVQTRYLYKHEGEFKPHSKKGNPAVIFANGDKEWRKNGELHNADGPAVVKHTGEEEYFLQGTKKTKTNWGQERRKNMDSDNGPNPLQLTYSTQKALKAVHGNVPRSKISGSRGNWIYNP